MNIIYDGSSVRVVNQHLDDTYSLDELVFFIDKKTSMKNKLYLIIQDSAQKFDAVSLKQSNSTSSAYYNYVVNVDVPLKIKSGECRLSILGINVKSLEVDFSTSPLTIRLENNTYNFKAQIALIEQFSKTSSDTYKGMLEVCNQFAELLKLQSEKGA